MTISKLFISHISLIFAASFSMYTNVCAESIYTTFEEKQDKIRFIESGTTDIDPDESVADSIQFALARNPQISLAIAQLDAAKAEKFLAVGKFLPSIEGTASYAHEDWRSRSLETLNQRDGATLGITVRQPVFQGMTGLHRLRAQKSQVRASEFSVLDSKSQIALLAARAHASVTLANEILAHRMSNRALVKEQLEITEARMKAGAQSRTGVEQARMRFAQAAVAVEQARARKSASDAFYTSIVGHAPRKLSVDLQSMIATNTESLDQAIVYAINNNPSLNAARERVRAAQFSKRAAYGNFSPNLNIEGNFFRRYDQGAITSNVDEYQIVARLRIPLFSQGSNIANLRSTSSETAQQIARQNSEKLSIVELVSRNWGEINAAKRRQAAAKKAIEAAELSVHGLKVEFDAGKRTVIDVLDGQRDLVDTKISLSQADFDLRIANYELAAAMGQLIHTATKTDAQ